MRIDLWHWCYAKGFRFPKKESQDTTIEGGARNPKVQALRKA